MVSFSLSGYKLFMIVCVFSNPKQTQLQQKHCKNVDALRPPFHIQNANSSLKKQCSVIIGTTIALPGISPRKMKTHVHTKKPTHKCLSRFYLSSSKTGNNPVPTGGWLNQPGPVMPGETAQT